MKNLFKRARKGFGKIGLFVVIVGLIYINSNAAILSTNIPANRTINFGSNGFRINSIEIDNTNAATLARVYFYDAPFTNVFYTNVAYTNITRTNGTVVQWYTNVLGAVNSNVFAATIIYTNLVPPSTNFYPLFKTFNVNSNTVSTWEPPNPISVRGITLTNSAAVNMTITYDLLPPQ